ncbi:DUF4266 domain-containing protein [Algibacillus agarilyticus]|uniref:DUF4266 domain-containing protein n=1 Tax=Algibacillus agarilyticus TaxID=2234133 RepID=UPI000DCFCE56|nr:DUF4266 domain-containing protein [Algibacillus agarilyticus]
MKKRYIIQYAFISLSLIYLNGCTMLGVQPWERDLISKESMSLSVDDLDASLDDHIYFSKEGTSGGRGFSAGGCGCN